MSAQKKECWNLSGLMLNWVWLLINLLWAAWLTGFQFLVTAVLQTFGLIEQSQNALTTRFSPNLSPHRTHAFTCCLLE